MSRPEMEKYAIVIRLKNNSNKTVTITSKFFLYVYLIFDSKSNLKPIMSNNSTWFLMKPWLPAKQGEAAEGI
jgi:hypothetical protein